MLRKEKPNHFSFVIRVFYLVIFFWVCVNLECQKSTKSTDDK